MEQITIYCTEKQARKALKLGIHLRIFSNRGKISDETAKRWDMFNVGIETIRLPTTGQMIDWLEKQGIYVSINCIGDYVYEVWTKDINGNGKVIINSCLPTRKEATLAAIDVALDYLTKKQ